MTKDEIKARMAEIENRKYDTDGHHEVAEELLCVVLTQEGYNDLVAWFKSLDKWYE